MTLGGVRLGSVRGGGGAGWAGLPLSRCATAPPQGARLRIPLTTQCGQRGRAPRPAEVGAGLPLSRCATAPPQGARLRIPLTTRCGQRGRAPRPAEVGAGLPLSRCATAPPQGARLRIPLTTRCGQRGESAAASGGRRGPPPQSLRDSSPSGGAISGIFPPLGGGAISDSADHSMCSAGGERNRLVQSVLSGWVAWAVQRRRGWSLRAGLGGSAGFLPSQE